MTFQLSLANSSPCSGTFNFLSCIRVPTRFTLGHSGIRPTPVFSLPPGFRYLSAAAGIYTPYASEPSERAAARCYSGRGGQIIARLKPGVSMEAAQAEVDALDSSKAHDYPQASPPSDTRPRRSRSYRPRMISMPPRIEAIAFLLNFAMRSVNSSLSRLTICVGLATELLGKPTARDSTKRCRVLRHTSGCS